MRSFDYIPARQATSAAIFASPHSGRDYDAAFLRASVLDQVSLRSSEDAFVDLFLRAAPASGAPVLLGAVPRAYVDYNRAATELDPALIDGVARNSANPRVLSGLGVIPRVVAGGRAIYRGKLPMAEAEARLARYWFPYHAQLSAIVDRQRARFGRSILFDLHSMPHDAIAGSSLGKGQAPEIVLGDRFGAACHPDISARVAEIFRASGLRVARNSPFAGAYVVQRYGTPSMGQHAIQIEIDRALYMDERTITPRSDFTAFQALMDKIVVALAALGQDMIPMGQTAAE
ncbi:MAG: N-formylglutamate amidohydrolase [Roseinatronobacter sp.]